MNDRELVRALRNAAAQITVNDILNSKRSFEDVLKDIKSLKNKELFNAAANRIIALLAENGCPTKTYSCAASCEACWEKYFFEDAGN